MGKTSDRAACRVKSDGCLSPDGSLDKAKIDQLRMTVGQVLDESGYTVSLKDIRNAVGVKLGIDCNQRAERCIVDRAALKCLRAHRNTSSSSSTARHGLPMFRRQCTPPATENSESD